MARIRFGDTHITIPRLPQTPKGFGGPGSIFRTSGNVLTFNIVPTFNEISIRNLGRKFALIGSEINRALLLDSHTRILLAHVKARFAKRGPLAKRDPSGKKWKPLVPPGFRTVNLDLKDILVDTGHLRDSIVARRTAVRLGKSKVIIEAKAPYASIHQLGGTGPTGNTIPARAFLGISIRGLQAISELRELQARRLSAIWADPLGRAIFSKIDPSITVLRKLGYDPTNIPKIIG